MLATLGTTNQETGVFSDKMDRAVETEEFSQTVEFSHLEKSLFFQLSETPERIRNPYVMYSHTCK